MDGHIFFVNIILLVIVCNDVTAGPVIITTLLGAEATLPCLIKSSDNGQLTWSNAERIIAMGQTVIHASNRFSVQKRSTSEYNLLIRSVKREDEQTFTCKVNGQVRYEVKVQIEAKPSWVDDETSDTKVYPAEYTNMTLNCRSAGRPSPEITWYREGETREKLPVTGFEMTIFNITRYHTDNYTCTARNKNGEISRTMSVNVVFEPEVHIYEPKVSAKSTEDVVWTCVIQGYPILEIFWKSNNGVKWETIDHWKYKLIRDDVKGYPVTFLTLKLNGGSWGNFDYGTYTCNAIGNKVTKSASAYLKKPTEEETIINYN